MGSSCGDSSSCGGRLSLLLACMPCQASISPRGASCCRSSPRRHRLSLARARMPGQASLGPQAASSLLCRGRPDLLMHTVRPLCSVTSTAGASGSWLGRGPSAWRGLGSCSSGVVLLQLLDVLPGAGGCCRDSGACRAYAVTCQDNCCSPEAML